MTEFANIITLTYIPFEDAIDGDKYITKMKHGYIEGYWDSATRTCSGYYWRDMEWYPTALYKVDQSDTTE
jgi:hypothetical protein